MVAGSVVVTVSGVADSSPEVLLAGVGSLITVVALTDSGRGLRRLRRSGREQGDLDLGRDGVGPEGEEVERVADEARRRRYVDAEGGPGQRASSPTVAGSGLGVAAQRDGRAVVPAWAVLVHDVGVVTVPASAGDAGARRPTVRMRHRAAKDDEGPRRCRTARSSVVCGSGTSGRPGA